MYPERIPLSRRLELQQIGGSNSNLYLLAGDTWFIELEGSAPHFTGLLPDGPAIRLGDTIAGHQVTEISCEILDCYVRLS